MGMSDFQYVLDNQFFIDIDGDLVQKGKVNVSLSVKRTSSMFEMNFLLDGYAIVPCDRCLDDMEIPINATNKLIVKFGKEYAEESDEIVIVPEDEGAINIAWFLYEFIALVIPMKHVHAPGKCNKDMVNQLRKHSSRNDDGVNENDDDFIDEGNFEKEIKTDSRWDTLKDLIENDTN